MGRSTPAQRAAQFGLESFVGGCFGKEGRDDWGFYITTHLALGPGPTVFVDDRPEDLSPDLTVVAVSPYLADDPHDRGLEKVARRAGLAPINPRRPTRSGELIHRIRAADPRPFAAGRRCRERQALTASTRPQANAVSASMGRPDRPSHAVR